jgi:hypothetical protein
MWKWIFAVVGVFILVGGVGFFFMLKGPDLSHYEFLKQPRVIAKPDVTVLEIPFEVDSRGLSKVFSALFKTYFKIPGVPKGPGMAAPAARYENLLDINLPPEERAKQFAHMTWKGSAALPVPASVKTLPQVKDTSGLHARLNTWHYGEVAEILHIGSYETEPGTIKTLTDYIAAQGYEIVGLHEEEYLRGPGMPFSKPERYYTIIRYPVKKKAQP